MTKAQAKFHFSPRPNRAHEIRWREWRPAAFEEAKREDKPILLSLSAVWCHWCHVMDETSYSDEGVINYINDHYIPVRVDNDQRPDVNARYNMGGWPSTAFLTPEGEVLAGATYVPPEQMRQVLPQVAVYYRDKRDEIAQKVAELRERRTAAAATAQRAALSPQIFDNVLRAVAESYDPVSGGFGDAPKFPHTDAIDLLLYSYRKRRDPDLLHMARKTLEFMGRGQVFDQEWGGFFRYATRRDWSEPHYEKMLEDNANLLRNLLALYRISGDQAHADVAQRVIDYMDAKLRDPAGFFSGSQDADEVFYKLSAAQRQNVAEPYIDPTCYTGWNAIAASAFLEASWALARPELKEKALMALTFAWEQCRQPGQGMYRFHDGTPQVLGLLSDQVHMARALLDACEVTTDPLYLGQAQELATFIVERFADKEGGAQTGGRLAGFFDAWDKNEQLGRLRERHKSIQDNAVCAEVFLRLYHLTRQVEYKEMAQAILEIFAPNYHLLSHFAAGYGRAVDMFLSGITEVNIVGQAGAKATKALQAAALALEVPARVVQVLDPKRDGQRLEALMLPPEPSPAAYVCAGTMCSAPLTKAEELAETVRQMQGAGLKLL